MIPQLTPEQRRALQANPGVPLRVEVHQHGVFHAG